ncbi:hypothetical protein BKA63DRAFT_210729 [Paraphoma chrysanthemicola]|nr:hypothetical protein BKA63DRAFT_210729 [Paraphoma chrysanthemicola]
MTELPSFTPDINSNSPSPNTLLASLDDQIRRLDLKIASLMNSKHVLEQVRAFISFHTTNNPTQPPTPNSDTHTRQYTPTRRPPTNLRREAIVRSASRREHSISPRRTAGLLASEDFEAAFESDERVTWDGYGDARMCVEAETFLSFPVGEGASGSSASVPPPLRSNAVGAVGTRGKRAAKRKLQENAAKAREAKRRKSGLETL